MNNCEHETKDFVWYANKQDDTGVNLCASCFRAKMETRYGPITTDYWAKPIPIRGCDWQAVFNRDYEPGCPVGHGATEAEAITELLNMVESEQ